MASTAALDPTYEAASAANGTAAPRPKSTPPSGGPHRRTADSRASSAPAAAGSRAARMRARGGGRLRGRPDGGQRARARGQEDRRAAALDDRDGEDVPEPRAPR